MIGSRLNLVILFVGVTLLVAVLGIVYLSAGAGQGRPIPDVLQNVAVGSLTGLVGLLVPTSRDPH